MPTTRRRRSLPLTKIVMARMATTWWMVAGIPVAAPAPVIGVGSTIVRGRLRGRYPDLFAPIDPAAVLFQQAHVRTTMPVHFAYRSGAVSAPRR
ncbi:MAG TPA: hypothetical protein VHI13_19465 [Candidatus Kapabacteria bacterium]|nr:hypothetical protein [Candidatus Kapabacteria bacterium]